MAGMMVGVLYFNWRAVRAMFRHFEIRRRLPEMIGAGEPLVVDIVVEPARNLAMGASWLTTPFSVKAPAGFVRAAAVAAVPHVSASRASRARRISRWLSPSGGGSIRADLGRDAVSFRSGVAASSPCGRRAIAGAAAARTDDRPLDATGPDVDYASRQPLRRHGGRTEIFTACAIGSRGIAAG